MLDLRIIASGVALSPFDLPAMLGRAEAAREIGDTIEGLIAYLDALGGDVDLEDGGDDEPDDDAKGDVSYTEWHTRGRRKMERGGAELSARALVGCLVQEDDEDDDADTGVEDNRAGFDPEEDYGVDDKGEGGSWPETGACGRSFEDDEGEDDGAIERTRHRDRIRRTRCTKVTGSRVDVRVRPSYRLNSPDPRLVIG